VRLNGLFGAALIYGDRAITPAISVLSTLEGFADVTYYVGYETVVHRDDGAGLPGWPEALFALMQRNSVYVSDFFQLPPDAVVEVGRRISI
jgi:K+ transporter